MSHQIHTYSELRQQIHDDLRIQHPEWVQPNGWKPDHQAKSKLRDWELPRCRTDFSNNAPTLANEISQTEPTDADRAHAFRELRSPHRESRA